MQEQVGPAFTGGSMDLFSLNQSEYTGCVFTKASWTYTYWGKFVLYLLPPG